MDRKKILVVEDDELLVKAIVDKFLREGFDVEVGYNGQEGLDAAKKNHPDLIIVDIIMPKMNGIEMVKELRNDAWGKQVPIIILTNMNPSQDILEAISEYKVSYCLVKSDSTLEEVIEKTNQVLKEGPPKLLNPH